MKIRDPPHHKKQLAQKREEAYEQRERAFETVWRTEGQKSKIFCPSVFNQTFPIH